MLERELTIVNRKGLHARAAAKFVTIASGFSSTIAIQRQDHVVNGKSIMGLMTLAASQGTELTLIIEGDDEQPAMEALSLLVRNGFDESD